MKKLSILSMSAAALISAAASMPAKADVVFTIGADNNFSGSGSPTGPFGTVDLIDGTKTTTVTGNGIAVGTVQVTVSLAPNVFANTGAADTLEFSLSAGKATLTTADITNLLFTGPGGVSSSSFALDLNPSAPNGAGFGGFGIGLNCTTCGGGTSPPVYDSLVFDVTDTGGLTSGNFVPGDAKGYSFLVDLGIPKTGGGFNTGYSGGTLTCTDCTPTQQNSVPEPASLALLGTALVGLGALRRRRKAA